MLRDAALLQLELLLAALDEGLILKDATPYNVQWRGARPVFVDVGSFERLRDGEPWAGYRQFCMLFLYPLLLQTYRGFEPQPLLRGRLDGITPEQCRSLLSRRDLLRRGVLTNVHLHAKLERRYGASGRDVKGELRSAGFGVELVKANVRRLQRLVRGLEWSPPGSAWSGYAGADAEAKAAFVREVVGRRRRDLVWDLGCNDGRHARLAAENARYVVAVDADQAVVDGLYRALATEGNTSILPLVVDLADPSPGLGWRGLERKPLLDRGRPDLVLCLALLHHLAISSNIPVREVLDWLRGLGGTLVIELVTREDEMVRRLLARKREGLHADNDRAPFEACLAELFEVERSQALPSGTRILYLAHPRQ